MNKVSLLDNDLLWIETLCGPDYVSRYLAIKNRNNEQSVRIVNTGMVSSGKSSLFNALIDSIETEQFPTGAARTTKAANYFKLNNISYIDTPGIDVRDEDDDLAFRTIVEADLIIMVHNIKTGPLNRAEDEWLKSIVNRLNSPEACRSRLIFVCTWKDTRDKDEDYENIVNDVKSKVFDIAGTEIPFFEVSVKKYLDGKSKNKLALCEKSGIKEFRSYLERHTADYLEQKNAFDRAEMNSLLKDIQQKITDVKKSDLATMRKNTKNAQQRFETQKNTWKQVYDFFSAKRRALSKSEDELRTMKM